MPSYTHLQRAEPVLVAHWLLAYVSMVERDMSRLADARERMNFCPLGSGAVAGATLALIAPLRRANWDFDAPTPNCMDATSDRDFRWSSRQALATLGHSHFAVCRRVDAFFDRGVWICRSAGGVLDGF